MIKFTCPVCKQERWIRRARLKLSKFTGLCSKCNACKQFSKAKHQTGEGHWRWNGGKSSTIYGYLLQKLFPADFFFPMARGDGYVMEHRLVMAKHLGRCLHRWEIVHHKNHIKDDNRIENLQLVTDDRHKQLTELEKRITFLEKENRKLRVSLEYYKGE